ncbi:hypothetical protein A6M14_09215 [Acinetobacter sp. Ac_877]|nr:hypothetical protein [Acinetobacter portensis]
MPQPDNTSEGKCTPRYTLDTPIIIIHNKANEINTLYLGCCKLVYINKQPKVAAYTLCALGYEVPKLSTKCNCSGGRGFETKYFSVQAITMLPKIAEKKKIISMYFLNHAMYIAHNVVINNTKIVLPIVDKPIEISLNRSVL